VREAFRKRLAAFTARATGSASRVERIALLAEPPSLDAGEITDKGSLNQRAALQRRAEAVAALYDSDSETAIRAH
jgi:feruloyl-CoA synthase